MERPPYEIALMHDHILRLEEEIIELKKCYKNNLKLLDNSDTNTTKLVNKVMKYEQTLKEIKEIAENGKRFAERLMVTWEQKVNVLTYANAILQKISKCEVIDETNTDNSV